MERTAPQWNDLRGGLRLGSTGSFQFGLVCLMALERVFCVVRHSVIGPSRPGDYTLKLFFQPRPERLKITGSGAPFRRRDTAGTRRRGRLRYVAWASGRRVLAASRRQDRYENTLPKAWEQGFGLQFLTASPYAQPGGRDKSGIYRAREAQKSSKRPERMQQRRAMIALAPRTD